MLMHQLSTEHQAIHAFPSPQCHAMMFHPLLQLRLRKLPSLPKRSLAKVITWQLLLVQLGEPYLLFLSFLFQYSCIRGKKELKSHMLKVSSSSHHYHMEVHYSSLYGDIFNAQGLQQRCETGMQQESSPTKKSKQLQTILRRLLAVVALDLFTLESFQTENW